jgi:predicted polyphosphate/ATP-dependent NAD kinase
MKTIHTKETLKAALQTGAHSVTFTKKDGTMREMIASLHADDIPVEHTPKGTGIVSDAADSPLRAYDIANEGWRSINVSTVTSVVPFNND